MPPWSLCGWQGIWWNLEVHMNMLRLPLIIAYVLLTCHLYLVFFLLIQLCLGCDQIFWFGPCTPHHNHLHYFHPTMGAHLLCLESITHHSFQLGQKVLNVFFSTNSSKIWPTMNFFPTSSPPPWSNAPCPIVDKGH